MRRKDISAEKELELVDAEDIAEIATRIYAKEYQEAYEQEHSGWFVAIDVNTRKGYLGEHSDDAFDEAERDNAKGPLFLIRIGHTSACQMGYSGSQFV